MYKSKIGLNNAFYKLAIILLFVPCIGHTQTLNLYDAVTKAVANYPLMQKRQAEVAAGKAHVTTVNGYRLPNLTLQDQLDLGTNNSLPGSYLTYGMVPSTPGNTNSPVQNNSLNPNNVALSYFQWDFFNFGYYNAQTKEAKAQLAVNEANYGSDKYTITQNIISLYLDWLKKFRLLQIQNDNMQRAQVILTAIRATVNSGLKPGVDSATASANYADARISYLDALNNYNYDQIAIGTYTGINSNDVSPDTSIVQSLLQQAPVLPLSNSVATGHPLLEVYQKQYEQQLADINTISKKYLPHFGLEGVAFIRNSGISYAGDYPSDPLSGMPYSKYNYLFGATVTYNLFDLKHRQNEMAEGKSIAQAKQSALQMEQLSLNEMLQQANSTYATTVEKLNEIPIELYSATQAYGQQLALYRSGLNTLIDLTNAEYVLLQAETNYVIMQDELLQVLYIRAGLGGQLDSFLQYFKR
jgi:outer membrane protein, adhesin transport system